jgi:hypothetical protein
MHSWQSSRPHSEQLICSAIDPHSWHASLMTITLPFFFPVSAETFALVLNKVADHMPRCFSLSIQPLQFKQARKSVTAKPSLCEIEHWRSGETLIKPVHGKL